MKCVERSIPLDKIARIPFERSLEGYRQNIQKLYREFTTSVASALEVDRVFDMHRDALFAIYSNKPEQFDKAVRNVLIASEIGMGNILELNFVSSIIDSVVSFESPDAASFRLEFFNLLFLQRTFLCNRFSSSPDDFGSFIRETCNRYKDFLGEWDRMVARLPALFSQADITFTEERSRVFLASAIKLRPNFFLALDSEHSLDHLIITFIKNAK